jgi:hypothetical protein
MTATRSKIGAQHARKRGGNSLAIGRAALLLRDRHVVLLRVALILTLIARAGSVAVATRNGEAFASSRFLSNARAYHRSFKDVGVVSRLAQSQSATPVDRFIRLLAVGHGS